jgi:hypothetical protein
MPEQGLIIAVFFEDFNKRRSKREVAQPGKNPRAAAGGMRI